MYLHIIIYFSKETMPYKWTQEVENHPAFDIEVKKKEKHGCI